MAFNDPLFLVFLPFYKPLPLRVGPTWWPTANDIWQNWWNSASVTRLQWDCSFYLVCTLLVAHSGGSQLQAVSCPMEKPTWQGTEGDLQPMTSNELRLSAQTVCEELNLVNNLQRAWKCILPLSSLYMSPQLKHLVCRLLRDLRST